MFGRKTKPKPPKPPKQKTAPNHSSVARFPWIEAIASAAVALFFYFILKNHEAAEIFAITGAILTIGRIGYSELVERSLSSIRDPLNRIGAFFDVSQSADYGVFRDTLHVYARITEDEFRRVKDGIVEEARQKLLYLANEKRSEVLATTRYYEWLLPMLGKTSNGQKVYALSMMRDAEWDDSVPEREFIKLMKEAAARGVEIKRVFVMNKGLLEDVLKNEAISSHQPQEQPIDLRGYYVEVDELKKADAQLFEQLGDGFIVFDDRVALVDMFSESGAARGYVTMNGAGIAHLKDVFNRLMILARELKPQQKAPVKVDGNPVPAAPPALVPPAQSAPAVAAPAPAAPPLTVVPPISGGAEQPPTAGGT